MAAKSSRAPALHNGVIAWERAPITPLPDVMELPDSEADSQWAASCLNQYLDHEERAFAPTAPSPLR
jgi:hypothetical protein